ncbi:MAG: sigma-E processing peptidase SpoIIGA [Peptococcia bacterium]|jgi:stage II sporulation protein GA (sporulation sigma-E factor processing peptidase)
MEETGLTVKVYLDVILLVNFIMDFFILWATGKLSNLPVKISRLVLGAFIGALYSIAVLLPQWSFFSSFLGKSICAFLMVLVAYPLQGVAKFIRSYMYLYVISFAMGGAVLAAVFLLDTSPGFMQVWNGVGIIRGIHYSWLVVALVVVGFLGYGGFHYLRKGWLQEELLNSLTIYFHNNKVMIPALLDTGNQLIDPFTKKPVIVVERAALEKLLPKDFLPKTKEGNSEISELPGSLDETWSSRLRLIPFNSVGKSNGLMIGFQPDIVVIKNKKKEIITSEVFLGLVNRPLSGEGRYRALLHPQILQEH